MEWVSCDLCGVNEAEPFLLGRDRRLGGKEEFQVVRCRNCGLIYTNPRPTPEEVSRYYPPEYSPFVAGRGGVISPLRKAFLRREVERLRGLMGEGARVLEVGCGTGEYLAALRDVGRWSVMGLEPSHHAADMARERGLEVLTGTLEEVRLEEQSFNLLILRHVLEHLPSPSRTLGEVHRLLREGGLCLLTLPDIGSLEARGMGRFWYDLDLPRHLYHFTKESLLRLLEKQGFKMRCFGRVYRPHIWVGSLQYALEEKGAPSFLTRGLRIDSPFPLLLFSPLSLLFGLLGQSSRMTAVAEKRVCVRA